MKAKFFFSLVSFLLAIMAVSSLHAKTILHYGLKSGVNVSTHYGNKGDDLGYKVKTIPLAGYIGGGFLEMEIIPELSLVYEALVTAKGSREEVSISELEGEALAKPARMNIDYRLYYVEIPVLIKITAFETERFKLNALTGTAMSLKFAGKHKLDGHIFFPEDDGSFTEIIIKESSHLEELNMFDFSFVYGGSLELNSPWQTFLEYRFTLGWDYLKLPTYELADPTYVELRNQAYSLMLGLRF
ncbi:MAG: outer membrane beta-barrel protein [Candidatus Cloacimonetes bacterium]|nr:outer membrane beta-barrel protein [Candidatus Cloacimonadota bacterium]